jgi:hypothetical protein
MFGFGYMRLVLCAGRGASRRRNGRLRCRECKSAWQLQRAGVIVVVVSTHWVSAVSLAQPDTAGWTLVRWLLFILAAGSSKRALCMDLS